MSLAKRLAEVKPKKSGLPCGVSRVLEKLSESDQKALNSVLFDEPRNISNVQLHQVLLDEGYDIAYSSVALHRRNNCRCFIGRDVRKSQSV
jgi:hypothetical protein